jgi:hypothetical protein
MNLLNQDCVFNLCELFTQIYIVKMWSFNIANKGLLQQQLE